MDHNKQTNTKTIVLLYFYWTFTGLVRKKEKEEGDNPTDRLNDTFVTAQSHARILFYYGLQSAACIFGWLSTSLRQKNKKQPAVFFWVGSATVPRHKSTRTTNQTNRMASILTWYFGSRFFPADELCRWFAYGNNFEDKEEDEKSDRDCLSKREFCFIFKHPDGSSGYKRPLGFDTATALREALKEYGPHAINIGACYKSSIKHKGTVPAFVDVDWKELVFDIDLSAYDQVRGCCQGTKMCPACWPLITAAVEIIHEFLVDAAGYTSILWLYSGRRGVHCWVCDKRARTLDNHQRSALLKGMSLFPIQEKVINPHGVLHPIMARMVEQLHIRFVDRLKTQNLFGDKRIATHLLALVGDDKIRSSIAERQWTNGVAAWEELQRQVNAAADNNTRAGRSFRCCLDAIVVEAMGPRFDGDVTRGQAHLIRCPFSPHQETGQICVPFDPARPFNPFVVPTLEQLEAEVNRGRKETSIDRHLKYFKQTFLQETVFPMLLTDKDKPRPRIIKFVGEK